MKNLKLIALALLIATSCQQKNKNQSEEKSTIATAPQLQKTWETDTLLTTSEAVIYHPESKVLFVSCINGTPPDSPDNDGFIAQVSPENGEILKLKWAKGISAPKGMGIVGNSLFVTNITEVLELDIASGQVLKNYPVEGAVFLNDITTLADGTVLISDSGTNKIWSIKDSVLDHYMEDAALQGPNGLLATDDNLYVASYGGAKGDFIQVDYDTQALTVVTDSIVAGDGIAKAGDAFLVSTWPGQIFHVDANGDKTLLSDTRADKVNSADIWYIEDLNLLLVPTFFANSVAAYQLKQ